MKRTTSLLFAFFVLLGLSALWPSRRPQTAFLGPVQAKGCTLNTLKGSYGFSRSGTTPNGALGAVGITDFDGKGSTTTRQAIRVNGTDKQDLFDPPSSAKYSVNPDCSGKFLDAQSGAAFSEFVIVSGGEEVLFTAIGTSSSNTVTGVMKRIDKH